MKFYHRNIERKASREIQQASCVSLPLVSVVVYLSPMDAVTCETAPNEASTPFPPPSLPPSLVA